MRPGPKFELTKEMVIENMRTVVNRLGLTRLSHMMYEDHGSFSTRAITRKWKWSELCAEAGIGSGVNGRPAVEKKACFECKTRVAMANLRYCRTCTDRMKRNSGGFL